MTVRSVARDWYRIEQKCKEIAKSLEDPAIYPSIFLALANSLEAQKEKGICYGPSHISTCS